MNYKNLDTTIELTVFNVGEVVCGLKTEEIQEIIKFIDITKVFQAPKYIKGVINLRGNIVTVVDMKSKFNIDEISESNKNKIIIVRLGDESIGLLVDNVDDIIIAEAIDIDMPPSNISGLSGKFFTGIYKKRHPLVAILNIEEILEII